MIKEETLHLTGGGKKENRRELDFYPTPKEVTVALMEFLKLEPSIIYEPACGDGSMSEVLKNYGHNVISSDLRETGYGHGNINFLTYTPKTKFDAIITNPPFNISQEFIEKSLTLAPIVAMVLKSQYFHAKKRFDLIDKNPPAWVLPLTWRPDFLGGERGGAPTMECIWAVWIQGDTLTKYKPLQKPILKND